MNFRRGGVERTGRKGEGDKVKFSTQISAVLVRVPKNQKINQKETRNQKPERIPSPLLHGQDKGKFFLVLHSKSLK